MFNVKKVLTIITLMWCCALQAQRHIVFSDNIASLQVVAGTRWQDMPIIRLHGNEPINIAFDELSHEYHRFSYSITHLDYDWKPSEGLFTSDYISGFQDGLTIESNEQSINTIQNYTHYSLQIPNDKCRLTMSGNYRLDIRDENNSGETVLSVFFMVSEDLLKVGTGYIVNTDIDNRKSHQQVEVNVDYSPLRATDPQRQLRGYVLQNGRWDNARPLPSPSRINQKMLEWVHCRDLIFDAGNVYHKFEILDIHRNSMNVENNVWDAQNESWHTFVWPCYERRSYVYDEAATGAFYIRHTDNYENNTTSEYTFVHFFLQADKMPGRLFLNGTWTNDRFLPEYEMVYDEEMKMYEGIVWLKYGYYSYQFLAFPDSPTTTDNPSLGNGVIIEGDVTQDENVGANLIEPQIPKTEGSFFENRNTYTTLIYFRNNGDRTDRLVGVSR